MLGEFLAVDCYRLIAELLMFVILGREHVISIADPSPRKPGHSLTHKRAKGE